MMENFETIMKNHLNLNIQNYMRNLIDFEQSLRVQLYYFYIQMN